MTMSDREDLPSEDEIFIKTHAEIEGESGPQSEPSVTDTDEQPGTPSKLGDPIYARRTARAKKTENPKSAEIPPQRKSVSEETQEKRRQALARGREARTEKLRRRKLKVQEFFGADCLKPHTLKHLEAAMASANEALGAPKKIFVKKSASTVEGERVLGEKPAAKRVSKKVPLKVPPASPVASCAASREIEVTPQTPKPELSVRCSPTPPPKIWKPKAKRMVNYCSHNGFFEKFLRRSMRRRSTNRKPYFSRWSAGTAPEIEETFPQIRLPSW